MNHPWHSLVIKDTAHAGNRVEAPDSEGGGIFMYNSRIVLAYISVKNAVIQGRKTGDNRALPGRQHLWVMNGRRIPAMVRETLKISQRFHRTNRKPEMPGLLRMSGTL